LSRLFKGDAAFGGSAEHRRRASSVLPAAFQVGEGVCTVRAVSARGSNETFCFECRRRMLSSRTNHSYGFSARRRRARPDHWLKNINASRSRALIRRIAVALGIVHAQGLVHGKLDADVIMTTDAEEPDFQLSGFEWSLWVSADTPDKAHAALGPDGLAQRAGIYSFAEDWRSLAHVPFVNAPHKFPQGTATRYPYRNAMQGSALPEGQWPPSAPVMAAEHLPLARAAAAFAGVEHRLATMIRPLLVDQDRLQ
jgi:hypothetical protein